MPKGRRWSSSNWCRTRCTSPPTFDRFKAFFWLRKLSPTMKSQSHFTPKMNISMWLWFHSSCECHVCQDQTGLRHVSLPNKTLRGYELRLYKSNSPRGSSNQDDIYVTAQALPLSMHNETKQTWADLELSNCHRQSVHHPRWRRIHLPESQQKRDMLLESALHFWADLELPNCHRHSLHDPR